MLSNPYSVSRKRLNDSPVSHSMVYEDFAVCTQQEMRAQHEPSIIESQYLPTTVEVLPQNHDPETHNHLPFGLEHNAQGSSNELSGRRTFYTVQTALNLFQERYFLGVDEGTTLTDFDVPPGIPFVSSSFHEQNRATTGIPDRHFLSFEGVSNTRLPQNTV